MRKEELIKIELRRLIYQIENDFIPGKKGTEYFMGYVAAFELTVKWLREILEANEKREK